ncbi:sce7726 family protein [Buttiauxella ferragutiae]|uniref:sce7726 family protein n=1 Tax=Buttiauxella ferragutiae TaxID=82989 RepID=UPI003524863D
MSEQLREQDVKIALIDWLFKKGLLSDAAIINEMVVANWSRRADIAIANGHLQAFEIKSDFDSLKRLDGQLQIFTSRFEKVTVVCSPKFTCEVTNRVRPDVGIIEYHTDNHGVRFKVIQRGRVCSRLNKNVYLSFLLKAELKNLLIENGNNTSNDLNRNSLEAIAEKLPLNKIRGFVLSSIKKRYKVTSEKFLARLHDHDPISISDLKLLSKAKHNNEISEKYFTHVLFNKEPQEFHSVDTDLLRKKYGEMNFVIPERVLKRVIR